MASTINAKTTGVGGIDASGDASGVLALQTAGVTALSISAAQVVSFTNPVASLTLTSATLITPTIDSAQVPTVSGTAPIYMCRAWVNFNGTGTVAIRASGNVSSITDNGTGNYTVNFTTAMPDANYSANLTADIDGVADFAVASTGDNTTPRTTSLVRVRVGTAAGSPADSTVVAVVIFR